MTTFGTEDPPDPKKKQGPNGEIRQCQTYGVDSSRVALSSCEFFPEPRPIVTHFAESTQSFGLNPDTATFTSAQCHQFDAKVLYQNYPPFLMAGALPPIAVKNGRQRKAPRSYKKILSITPGPFTEEQLQQLQCYESSELIEYIQAYICHDCYTPEGHQQLRAVLRQVKNRESANLSRAKKAKMLQDALQKVAEQQKLIDELRKKSRASNKS